MIFSPRGERVATLRMPDGFTPHQFGVDFVIGAWRGPDGVEYVRSYPLPERLRR